MKNETPDEIKKRIDAKAVSSITNILKLYGFNLAGLTDNFRKAVIAIYQQGAVDVLEELKKDS